MKKKYEAHWTCILGYPHILIYEFIKVGYPLLVEKRVFINKEEKQRYLKRIFPLGSWNKHKKFLNALYEEKIGIPERIIEQYQKRGI